jgi:hypothetical protein
MEALGDPLMNLSTSNARTCSWFGPRVGGEQDISPTVEDVKGDGEEGTEALCRCAVEEGLDRRSAPNLAAIGATNFAAQMDAAAISSATLCDKEVMCGISSPLWLVPPPLRPA